MLTLTGAQILAFVGNLSPSAAESEWADAVAAAIISGVNTRLNGGEPSTWDELNAAALLAGAEGYKRKEALFGVTGYADLEGNAIRVAKDWLEGVKPMLDRYSAGPGMG